jgi:hypothetical protein
LKDNKYYYLFDPFATARRVADFSGVINVSSVVDWSEPFRRSGSSPNIRINYDPYFAYAQNRAVPAPALIWQEKIIDFGNRQIEWVVEGTGGGTTNNLFYFGDQEGGAKYNSVFFNSTASNESKHVLAIGFDHDGRYLSYPKATYDGARRWRHIHFLGLKSQVDSLAPINSDESFFYFGTNMNLVGTYDYGIYTKLHPNSVAVDHDVADRSRYRQRIPGDGRWFSLNRADSKWYRSNDFRMTGKVFGLNDFTDFFNYRSSLIVMSRVIVTDAPGSISLDKVKRVGAPEPPVLKANYDVTSTIPAGTKFYYRLAFQFFGGKTTALSSPSALVTVPNDDTKIEITRINLEDLNGVDLYDRDDIEFILLYRSELAAGLDDLPENYTEPNLIAQLEKDGLGDWYYGLPTPPYPKETFVDNSDTYPYNPFDETQLTSYKIKEIFVHKNRLVLIKDDNTLQYSDIDNAVAIPDANIRPVESGDGFEMIGGISAGDYAYIFKTNKIYAILGDIFDGQIIDISKDIGTRYKSLKTVHNNIVYFLNDDSIYRLVPGRPPENIMRDRVFNYFDTKRDDCIDFDNLADSGFAVTDVELKEVRFFVPQKIENQPQETNNLSIIYNIKYEYFKTVRYHHDITDEVLIENLKTNVREYLMADVLGNVFNKNENKNDDGKAIKFVVRTTEFNLNTDTVQKIYKLLKISGQYLTDIYVTYWIDGERYKGDVLYTNEEEFIKLWNNGRSKRMMVEFSGKKLNQPPTRIEEISIGFTRAKGHRR